MNNLLDQVEGEIQAVLKFKGEVILDSELAELLRLVEETGSLLSACRLLSIPYSRAWERISRVERKLGVKVVLARRGGGRRGGMRLTEHGRTLLDKYSRYERKVRMAVSPVTVGKPTEPDLTLAHSHDPILTIVLERLRSEGLDVEDACVGSGMALASLSLGEVDVAASHLYDPETGEYNVPYLHRYWLDGRTSVVGGYMRELVFAFNPDVQPMSVEETVRALLRGELRLVNRNVGSGTRVYLDHLLSDLSGGRPLEGVRGYGHQVNTHDDAARAVAAGRADVGLMLRASAEYYGLRCTHVAWERFEYIALNDRLDKKGVSALRDALKSDWLRRMLENTPGFKPIEGSQ